MTNESEPFAEGSAEMFIVNTHGPVLLDQARSLPLQTG